MTFKSALRQAKQCYVSLTPKNSDTITVRVAKFTLQDMINSGHDGDDPEVCEWSFENGVLFVAFST